MKQARYVRGMTAVHLFTLMALLVAPAVAQSENLPLPPIEGPVVLEITGQIQTRNSDNSAVFDIEGLESLGLVEVVTETPWTDGEATFTGVLARDLLEAVGGQGGNVRAVALNDYAVKIPVADFVDYEVIIATSRDGNRMRVRDRGPLWVIYPWSHHPELRTELYYSRSIWQLSTLEVTE